MITARKLCLQLWVQPRQRSLYVIRSQVVFPTFTCRRKKDHSSRRFLLILGMGALLSAAARLENKALLPSRTNGGHLSDIRPPEIEIELEKEREGETGHPAPAAYGRYNNVILTDTELSGLKTELPDKWEYYIDRLSCHIASTGKQYHSHAATIYKWAQEDAAKGKAAPKQGIPDYSCKEGESL